MALTATKWGTSLLSKRRNARDVALCLRGAPGFTISRQRRYNSRARLLQDVLEQHAR
jgi:hypothetical protein